MTSPPESGRDRFDELAALLRAGKPAASPELRERVRLVAAAGVEPARRRRFSRGRALLVLAPVAVLAVVLGTIGRPDGDERQVGAEPALRERGPTAGMAQDSERAAPAPSTPAQGGAGRASALPPSSGRLQDYRAELRVRVPNARRLSDVTSRAMRLTRSLGGFIVSASYARGGEGDSRLVVRVPVGKVQEAILGFSQLGTLLAQRIEIADLQGAVNRQNERIAELHRSIAAIERELRDPALTPEARATLEARLLAVREELGSRREVRNATVKRGRLSRITLTLTTREDRQEPVPAPPGEFEDTLRDAVALLAKLVAWFLYAFIVAIPFLALTLAAVLVERLRRRRGALAVLERA